MLRRFWSLTPIACFSAIFLIAFSQTAGASPFSLGTLVAANHGCIPSVTCPNINGDEDNDFELPGPNNGAGFVSSSSGTDGFTDPNFVYSAAADASFGRLHARASGSYDLPSLGIRGAAALALATDQLTISAPGLDGQSGTLDVSFLLDGTLAHTGSGGALVSAFIIWGNDPEAFSGNNDAQAFDFLTVPSGAVTVPVSFVWGQPFYLSMVLGVAAGTPISCLACNNGDGLSTPAMGIGSGTADFFNTMTLSGLVPKDVNNNPVLDAQFSSASNTQYSVNGVPEPGSLLLLGIGLAATFARRRRA